MCGMGRCLWYCVLWIVCLMWVRLGYGCCLLCCWSVGRCGCGRVVWYCLLCWVLYMGKVG